MDRRLKPRLSFRVPRFIFAAAVVVSACSMPDVERATVEVGDPISLVRVIDGDSIEAELDGEVLEMRLVGYNAPELYVPSDDGSADRANCNGDLARAILAELLASGSLEMVGTETDRFGRRLAEIHIDGAPLAATMVDQGWGLASASDPGLWTRMAEAANNGVGMWGDGCGEPARIGLEIGDTNINPPGDDRENLDQEWVEITNGSAEAIDLAGWSVRDDTTSNRFTLDGILGPGATLRIRTGRGSSTAGDLYLNESFPVWSNGGDTVIVQDPNGVVAAWRFIEGRS